MLENSRQTILGLTARRRAATAQAIHQRVRTEYLGYDDNMAGDLG